MFQNINSLCSKWYFLIASSLPYFVLLFNVLGGEEIMAERGSGTGWSLEGIDERALPRS